MLTSDSPLNKYWIVWKNEPLPLVKHLLRSPKRESLDFLSPRLDMSSICSAVSGSIVVHFSAVWYSTRRDLLWNWIFSVYSRYLKKQVRISLKRWFFLFSSSKNTWLGLDRFALNFDWRTNSIEPRECS